MSIDDTASVKPLSYLSNKTLTPLNQFHDDQHNQRPQQHTEDGKENGVKKQEKQEKQEKEEEDPKMEERKDDQCWHCDAKTTPDWDAVSMARPVALNSCASCKRVMCAEMSLHDCNQVFICPDCYIVGFHTLHNHTHVLITGCVLDSRFDIKWKHAIWLKALST